MTPDERTNLIAEMAWRHYEHWHSPEHLWNRVDDKVACERAVEFATQLVDGASKPDLRTLDDTE